ncbi:hypothetical protein LJ739_00340 [Aestuariibacter halophilus]|uniref:Lipoprotein n=1 Tax=Fluctibacter halophilus TaxID=226011 RepID=A0ABS8G651_9ALTE|nr:hypothetical protein [Aestuariibacter halophilus]MCC2614686.1 hypothetical protein [Aestuariibacter halophilus]
MTVRLLGCLVMLLSACSSSSKRSLETQDDLIMLHDSPDTPAFIFTLRWFIPLQDFAARQGNVPWYRWDALQTNLSLRHSIDNQTKLQLEEYTVSQLRDALRDQDACPHGYEITTTRWFERSIELRGRCNARPPEQP